MISALNLHRSDGIAEAALVEAMLIGVRLDALDLLLDLSPRRMRRALAMACSFAVCARRYDVTADDVRQALALTEAGARRRAIGFAPWRSGVGP